ncbi:glycoside hydrolase family 17 protein [Xylariaceae sp. FL0594]|nr:glycoside hydrolase family 17 protein [Xylariaceae sp. FL0594]
MHKPLLFAMLASAGLCQSLPATDTPNCFPYGSAVLPKNLSTPGVPLDEWWCPPSMAYGFQGFSYPLEVADCSDASNSFEAMSADFAQMKRDFGASIVRMYYPLCLQPTVFANALKAGVANDMAVIFQVWTDFGISDDWKTSMQAIFDVLDSPELGPIAPYVVHSIDLGSEPITDWLDGGGLHFVADLAVFKQRVNAYGIPAGISEEWDRRGDMKSADGTTLGAVGQGVKDNSDYVHAHIMPYYRTSIPISGTWSYILGEMDWINRTVGLPTMITETQWSWAENAAHHVQRPDLTVQAYTQYWRKFDDECLTFKAYRMGWFIHTWRGESAFDILYPNGTGYVIPNWRPQKC